MSTSQAGAIRLKAKIDTIEDLLSEIADGEIESIGGVMKLLEVNLKITKDVMGRNYE